MKEIYLEKINKLKRKNKNVKRTSRECQGDPKDRDGQFILLYVRIECTSI